MAWLSASSSAMRAARPSASADVAPHGMTQVLVARRTQPPEARSQAIADPARPAVESDDG
eukprot:10849682-Lingulodinium_polyedra.AAC.1